MPSMSPMVIRINRCSMLERVFNACRAIRRHALDRIIDTVKMARKLRLNIAVGHGLDMRLIKLFKGLTEIDEFSIGQSLITHALLRGMQGAVSDTIDVIRAL